MPEPSTGIMIVLSGIVFFIMTWFYSTLLWSSGGGEIREFVNVTEILASLTIFPFVSYFDSPILAWAAVLPLYELCTFGFLFWMNCRGGCEKWIHTGFCISLAIMALSISLKMIYREDMPRGLEPFTLCLSVLGSMMYAFWGWLECILEMDNHGGYWKNYDSINWFGWAIKYRPINILVHLGHFAVIGVCLTYG